MMRGGLFGRKENTFLLRGLPWLICILLWFLVYLFVPEQSNTLELKYYDFLSAHNINRVNNKNIVIVSVDEESISNIGMWPWQRQTHAYLLQNIAQADAIGIDLLFVEEDHRFLESDQVFARAVKENGKVTLPYIYNNLPDDPYGDILPFFRMSAASVGYVNFLADNDNVVRRLYQVTKQPFVSKKIMSFPEAMLDQAKLLPDTKPNLIQRFFLLFGDSNSRMILYSNNPATFPIYSYDQVLKGEPGADFFKNKIVLIGSTATSLQDKHPTPSLAYNGELPGVLILANITSSMMNEELILIPNHNAMFIFGILLFIVSGLITCFMRNEYFYYYIIYSLILLAVSVLLLYYAKVWFPVASLSFLIICACIVRALIQRSSFRFMAYTDALTGLSNRYAFELGFSRILDEAQRKSQSTAFILMDVDFFKKYNDTYGHDLGDVVLKKVADVLYRQQKKGNIAARLGGEEFVLVIPNCSEIKAAEYAHKVRKEIVDLNIEHKASPLKVVTASFGVSVGGADIVSSKNKIHYQEADIALYEVKESGRNNVCVRIIGEEEEESI